MKERFRVMKTNEFCNSIWFRVACSCGENEHDVTVELERLECDMVSMTFYKKVYCTDWEDSFFKRQWWKVKTTLKLLFIGYIEMEESFIIRGDEHINSFIDALEKGKEYIKNER